MSSSSIVCPACGSRNSEFNPVCSACSNELPSLSESAQRTREKEPRILPGTQVGRYEIQDLIGVGAMGQVYRAWDPKLGRHAALKLLSARHSEDPLAQARMRREAKAVSALDHPGIAAVYEVGEYAGRPFIAMAFYEGETLQQVLERGPLSIEETSRIGAEIAAALGAAHGAGIIHRDVKTGNVILTREQRVKLVDFGLAKVATNESQALTSTGSILGTIAYMAPEQLAGEVIDQRADLWSLGVILYEALAGVPPFRGPGLTHAILSRRHERVTTLRGDTPEALASLLEKLLDKDPTERSASAADVERALRAMPEQLAAGVPLSGGRTSGQRRLMWALLLSIGLVLAWLSLRRSSSPLPQSQPAAAVLPAPTAARREPIPELQNQDQSAGTSTPLSAPAIASARATTSSAASSAHALASAELRRSSQGAAPSSTKGKPSVGAAGKTERIEQPSPSPSASTNLFDRRD